MPQKPLDAADGGIHIIDLGDCKMHFFTIPLDMPFALNQILRQLTGWKGGNAHVVGSGRGDNSYWINKCHNVLGDI